MKADYPDVDYRILKVNLSSQKGVREAADELLSWSDIPTLDIVVNSAGIMNIPERTINEDGLEITYGTNHIGHFLLTCLIMPKILKAAEGNAKGATRIINVSSGSPTVASPRFSDINFEVLNKDLPQEEQPHYGMLKGWGNKDPENKSYVPIEAYNQSKVANVLFSIGLNKRLYEKHGILSLSLHPGIIMTELSRDAAPEVFESIKAMVDAGQISFRTQGAGASTSLTAATDPKLALPVARREDGKENVGVFLSDCQIFDGITPGAASSDNAEKLWKISEGFVRETFAW
jgi:NAD(P)-dependent dehydrogenase (short-subunit alcohol dehydrogenase family)